MLSFLFNILYFYYFKEISISTYHNFKLVFIIEIMLHVVQAEIEIVFLQGVIQSVSSAYLGPGRGGHSLTRNALPLDSLSTGWDPEASLETLPSSPFSGSCVFPWASSRWDMI